MKKTKILTVLGVLLAMGITACAGGNESSESVAPTPTSETPVPSSETPAPVSSVVPTTSSVAPTTSSKAPTTSSKAPTTSSQTPASSSQTPSSSVEPSVPTKSVTYVSSSFVKGADGKMSLVITGTQSNYSAAELKFAFGLYNGTAFIVGSAEPADADYSIVPTLGDGGAFTLTIALEDLAGIAEGEFNIYLGPKGAYADVTSALHIEKGTKSGLKYRFGTRDDDGRLQIAELPPINFTDAFIKVVDDKPVLYFGGAFAGTEAEVTAYTPWVQVQSVPNAQGYESGFEQWGNHDLTAVIKVENNKAYVTADISSLPNACYNTHFNLKGQHNGEAIMENSIDQSNDKARWNGKDYWCWSDPTTSDQAHFWGHLGFVIAPAKFNITPNLNYEGAPAMDPIAVNNGKITLPADPTREDGYSFVGWFDAAVGGNQVTNDTVYNEETTIYAHWAEHQHVASTEWSKDETNHWHTCSVAGCPVAGYVMDKAAHTFGDVTVKTPATCTEDGAGEIECTVCGYKKDVVIPAAHKWGDAQKMAAGEGQVAYDLFTCASCSLLKADVKASDGTITGSNKSGTPEGFIKLNSNGNLVTWKINVPGTQSLAGTLYQRGVMDGWSTNPSSGNCTVTYAKSGGGNQGTNFVVTVNGVEVDMSATKNTTYYDMLKDGADAGLGSSYSPIGDCPIGTIELQPGENVITYKRVGSYNLAISDIIFLGKAHTHVAASEWSKDENQHWHTCTAAGCPVAGLKMDAADHTWGEQYDVVPATCTAKGSYKVKCTVCEYVKTVETDFADHTWGEDQTAVGDAIPHECSSCHTVAYDLAVASPAKLKSDITWNIAGLPAGKYEIQLNACAASTTLTQKYDSRYQFQVDSSDYIGASDDTATYAAYGLGTGEALANCQWSKTINQIDIAAGAASFTLHWTNKGYSAFIAGVRLVKVA